MPPAAAASCEHVTKVYWTRAARVEALRGVTARFFSGEVTAVRGPSGSGKSTLLRILAGLDRASSGRVEVGGVNVTGLSSRALRKARRGLIGYVFPRPADNFVPYLTVAEHVLISAPPGSVSQERALEALDDLGLAHRAGSLPQELSGGEQQRAAFAQILISRPTVVVSDEPTSELDTHSGAEVLAAVRVLAEAGTCLILATHDRAVADAADQVLDIREGTLAEPDPNARARDDSLWRRPNGD